MLGCATDGDVTTRTCAEMNGITHDKNRLNLKGRLRVGLKRVQVQLVELQHHGVGLGREKLEPRVKK